MNTCDGWKLSVCCWCRYSSLVEPLLRTSAPIHIKSHRTAPGDVIDVEVEKQIIRTKLKALWHPVSRFFWLKSDFKWKWHKCFRTEDSWLLKNRENVKWNWDFINIQDSFIIQRFLPLFIHTCKLSVKLFLLGTGDECMTQNYEPVDIVLPIASFIHLVLMDCSLWVSSAASASHALYLCIPLELFIQTQDQCRRNKINARWVLMHL